MKPIVWDEPKTKRKNKSIEQGIQTRVIEYLRLKGFYVQRLNAGNYQMGDRFIKGVAAGTPDVMAFKRVRTEVSNGIGTSTYYQTKLYFFEIKKPGENPSQIQLEKAMELSQAGALCFVIHSEEELRYCLR